MVIEYEIGDRVRVLSRYAINTEVDGNPGWVSNFMDEFCEKEYTIVDIGKEYYDEGHIALCPRNDPRENSFWFHPSWLRLVNGTMDYASFERVNEYRARRGEERLGMPVQRRKKETVLQKPWL